MTLLIFLFALQATVHTAGFQPADNYLINCGGSDAVNFGDGRIFEPDADFPSLLVSDGSRSISSSVPGLYSSARVFSAPASYRFRIQQSGRHFVRLHLSPIGGPTHDLRSAVFSVMVSGFKLLGDFSFVKSRSDSAVMKEFLIGADSGIMILVLIPADGSVAFVNGIEVVSVPENLIPSIAVTIPAGAPTEISSDRAIEVVYRINVGGAFVNSVNDTLWRVWEIDLPFLVNAAAVSSVSARPEMVKYPPGDSPEIAPRWIYATAQEMADAHVGTQKFNISWSFRVDSSFSYLVRLHFCDIVSRTLGHLVFNVYINNQTADRDFDISSRTMELSAAYFVDFVVEMGPESEKMLLQIGPSDLTNAQPNAILNGVEIMKLSNKESSLAKTELFRDSNNNRKRQIAELLIISAAGCSALAILTFGVLVLYWRRSAENKNRNPNQTLAPSIACNSGTKPSSMHTFVSSDSLAYGRLLPFSEIREATNNFDESFLLGMGGFGKVYKGVLQDGSFVAVKRGNPRSHQGLVEFRTEIEMLSKLRHRHLVSLIGYSHEPGEMVLVYEYMAGGSLRRHLYGSSVKALSWTQRLEICIGAAKGLHYLHTGAKETVIHRDVKTSNILLDDNLVSKVADFGLSKIGSSEDTHVSTAVKGSFGYLDPEYFRRQQLTEKSDVYSFGVVLMEVMCARPAIDPSLPREQVNVAEWAMEWQRKGQLVKVMDQNLIGDLRTDSLKVYGKTAEKCLSEKGIERPTMGEVLWSLEHALQLQVNGQGSQRVNQARMDPSMSSEKGDDHGKEIILFISG